MKIIVGTGTASNIQGNTIKNITWTNTSNAIWCGMSINAGKVNIGTTTGNLIGASEGNGSITFTGGNTGSVSY
jgi:hypothetical protein